MLDLPPHANPTPLLRRLRDDLRHSFSIWPAADLRVLVCFQNPRLKSIAQDAYTRFRAFDPSRFNHCRIRLDMCPIRTGILTSIVYAETAHEPAAERFLEHCACLERAARRHLESAGSRSRPLCEGFSGWASFAVAMMLEHSDRFTSCVRRILVDEERADGRDTVADGDCLRAIARGEAVAPGRILLYPACDARIFSCEAVEALLELGRVSPTQSIPDRPAQPVASGSPSPPSPAPAGADGPPIPEGYIKCTERQLERAFNYGHDTGAVRRAQDDGHLKHVIEKGKDLYVLPSSEDHRMTILRAELKPGPKKRKT
jgi:hypothetical protein